MDLDYCIQHNDKDIWQDLPELSSDQNQTNLLSRAALIFFNVAPSWGGEGGVAKLPHNQQGEAEDDRKSPVDDVEYWNETIGQKYSRVYKGEVEVES